jgi:hypothetical protein
MVKMVKVCIVLDFAAATLSVIAVTLIHFRGPSFEPPTRPAHFASVVVQA